KPSEEKGRMAMSLEETQQRVLLAVGQMLVTRAVASDTHFRRVCLDVEHWDAKDMLQAFKSRHAKYGTTPFDPDGNLLRLYPGGLTIWSGYPGAGKTTLLRQLVCHCLARGSAVFLASLEEEPEDVLSHLAATAAGTVELNAHQM